MIGKWWQYLIPKYGNWGVTGWYANGYRIGALIVFEIRSRIVE
jgi:hypothetical protein